MHNVFYYIMSFVLFCNVILRFYLDLKLIRSRAYHVSICAVTNKYVILNWAHLCV